MHKLTASATVQVLSRDCGCVKQEAFPVMPGAPTVGICAQVDRQRNRAGTIARLWLREA